LEDLKEHWQNEIPACAGMTAFEKPPCLAEVSRPEIVLLMVLVLSPTN